MRKSTLSLMAVLGVLLVGMTFATKFWTDQFLDEIKHAKDLTQEFREERHLLEPDSVVKLARVSGTSHYLMQDARVPGLLLEATPTREAGGGEPFGALVVREMAQELYERYPPERPIRWIEFHLKRPDGTTVPPYGVQWDENGQMLPLEAEKPPAPDKPKTPEKTPEKAPAKPPGPGTPESPGSPAPPVPPKPGEPAPAKPGQPGK